MMIEITIIIIIIIITTIALEKSVSERAYNIVLVFKNLSAGRCIILIGPVSIRPTKHIFGVENLKQLHVTSLN